MTGRTAEANDATPAAQGTVAERAFWETQRDIPHEEADAAATRLINSHFKNDAERARVSIPANPDRDDDLLIRSYIRQQMRKSTWSAGVSVSEMLNRLADFDYVMSCHVGIGYFDGTEITREWDRLVRPAMERLKVASPSSEALPASGVALEALMLARTALVCSKPVMAHYEEPNARHKAAFDAVEAAIAALSSAPAPEDRT